VARKRVALTDQDRRSETVIKEEDQTTRSHHAHATSPSQLVMNNRLTTNLSDEDTDDEDTDDESQDEKSSSNRSLDDTSDEESSDEEPHDKPETRKPAFELRRTAKAMICPPQAVPRKVFTHAATDHKSRMVRRDNPEKEILIYTSGQCFGKSKKKPAHAGCAVISSSVGQEGVKSRRFLLEQIGPEGIRHDMNRNNAELRALVAALELRDWSAEGWDKVTIATSSTYVHRGITLKIASWDSQGKLQGSYQHGKQLQAFDLWARAISLVNEHAYRGCEVQVWLIKQAEVEDAASAARAAAKSGQAPNAYRSRGDVRITWNAR